MQERVPAALAGQRLDRVVAMLADTSRAAAAELVSAGAVTVGGQPVTTRSHRVSEGDVLVVSLPEQSAVELTADPSVEVPVVFEDSDILVVDKPAGLVVHPGAGRSAATLVHGLLARYPEVAAVGQPDRPGIVHRLDAGTSGLMLVARSAPAYEELVAMLSSRQIDRGYRALVWGTVEAAAGRIEAPIGRSARDRTRMAVTVEGRPAVTRYEVLRRFEQPAEATELGCSLETGRTHQIRVHMASIGHPVVGDPKYGGSRSSAASGLRLDRPWLHSEQLGLEHPLSRERLSFRSPLPDDLVAILDLLR